MGDDLGPRAAGPEPPATALSDTVLEQDFDFGSLYALRAAVSAHAAAAGLTGNRLYDVVTTAHELAANAVRHGAGHGRLRLRLADGALYCEVSDDGREPAAGDADSGEQGAAGPGGRNAAWREEHGHGLWVVGQVADQFTVNRSEAATTATAVFALSAPSGVADEEQPADPAAAG
jgi:anti-sigma regulatory factor (Ser/Thr protein kinase)